MTKPHNAADPKAVSSAEDKAKLVRARELQDLNKLMHTEEGVRVLKRIIENGRVFHTTFNSNSNKTAFNEGRRDLALWLFSDVCKAAPDNVSLLILADKEV